MSYNIDKFKVKRLEFFKVPVKEFYSHPRKDWVPDDIIIKNVESMLVKIPIGAGFIEGYLEYVDTVPYIKIANMSIFGVGSGTMFSEVIQPAFQKSTGTLEAIIFWEEPDTIYKLLVVDGVWSEEKINL